MADPKLKNKLDSGEFILAPGIQDMITAVVANRFELDAVFASGYWLAASTYGLPDAGIVTYTQMVERMEVLVRTSNSPVIADADTGYGGLLNVQYMVQGYEKAGVSAIQLEDQEFPKKCGHSPGKRVCSPNEMVDRIRVAVETRSDDNLLIIGRTDARSVEGLSKSIERAQAYREAGADIVFVEALSSEDEMRTVCREIDAPNMVNITSGGTPMGNAEHMASLGYQVGICPSLTSLASAHAAESALQNMLNQGGNADPEGTPLFAFKEFNAMIGLEKVWEFEKKWARDD